MTDARIHDLGFRRYEGPRHGPGQAAVNLGVHAVQRVLGLKRQHRHKILPTVVIVLAFLPAVVFVGLAVFLPDNLIEEEILPSYAEYLGVVTFALVLFSSFVAPEASCTDRRTGMLSLYLAAPLTRSRYVLAKLGAVALVLAAVTAGPQLLMLVAFTLEGGGPGGVVDWLVLFGRIVVTGVVVAILFASFSMALSSLTTRRGVASASIALTLLVSGIITGTLVNDADQSPFIELFNLPAVALQFGWRVHGDPLELEPGLWEVGTPVIIAATLAWCVVFTAYTLWRYQRLEVSR